MAERIPQGGSKFTSPSEEQVWDVLKLLPENYRVYSNPNIDGRECDYVILGPDLGILFIEVKGWRLPADLSRDALREKLILKKAAIDLKSIVHRFAIQCRKHPAFSGTKETPGKRLLPISYALFLPNTDRRQLANHVERWPEEKEFMDSHVVTGDLLNRSTFRGPRVLIERLKESFDGERPPADLSPDAFLALAEILGTLGSRMRRNFKSVVPDDKLAAVMSPPSKLAKFLKDKLKLRAKMKGPITMAIVMDMLANDPKYNPKINGPVTMAMITDLVADDLLKSPPAKAAETTSMAIPGPSPAHENVPALLKEVAPTAQAEAIKSIEVFYGTNREQTKHSSPRKYYSKNRVDSLSYGKCTVTIPVNRHKVGRLESPSLFRLQFSDDLQKHIVVTKVEPTRESEFVAGLRKSLNGCAKKELVLFIHGFNTNFYDAIRVTAQLSYDLGHHDREQEAVPVCFSFPSAGSLIGYKGDVVRAGQSPKQLAEFLFILAREFPEIPLNIVAHSLGNRIFGNALAFLLGLLNRHLAGTITKPFREVAMAAPDVDREEFRNNIGTFLGSLAHRATLYASSEDRALKISRKFYHAGYRRAGESNPKIVVLAGMDSVDATYVSTEFTGHGYFARSLSVATDIKLLFQSIPPASRNLMPKTYPGEAYWTFRP